MWCVGLVVCVMFFFFSSRRRHTRCLSDWSSDVCSSDLKMRLPSGGMGTYAVWSADGNRIFYSSRAVDKIYQKAANNTGAEEVVEVASKFPIDASRDGRYLFTVTVGRGINRIWVLPLFGDRKPFPYTQTEFRENQPRLSP